MKKIIILLLFLVILCITGISYAIINANSIIAKYKPQLEEVASNTLNAPVTIGEIDVSIFPDTKFIVNELTTGSKDDKFVLNNLTFHANLMSLLKEGKIDIREISIKEPNLTFIQSKSGTRVAGLPTPKQKKKKSPRQKKQDPTTPNTEASAVTLPEGISLNLNSFSIENALITVINEKKEKLISLHEMNLDSSMTFQDNVITLPSFTFSTKINNKELFEANGEDITLHLQTGNITLPKIKANTFGGNFNSSLSLSGKQDLKAEGLLAGVLFERLVEAFKPDAPSPITGQLESFTYNLEGSLKDTPVKNITGPLIFSVKDGELKGANIAGEVLKAVASLPFIGEEIFGESGKEALTGDTTPLKSLTGTFSMKNGVLTTNDLKLESAIFDMAASGNVTTDAEVEMKTSLLFKQTFSENMAIKVKELSSLLNDEGRLEVPVTLKGKASNITVLPNVKRLASMGATRALEKGATKLLNNALGESGDGNVKIKDLGKAFGF